MVDRSASKQTRTIDTLIDSSPVLGEPQSLRERGSSDGYLFFRGLLSEEDVATVRQALLAVLDRHGLLDKKAAPMSGVLNRESLNEIPESDMRLDIGVSHTIYQEVQKLEAVHRLPHHPRLIALYQMLFLSNVLVHPRHIVRMVTPHPAMVPTPVHQDFPLIQGTPNTWTCWFPIGPCPQAHGTLAILPKSHQHGCLPVQPMAGAGGIEAQLCPGEDQWHSADFQAGDVLTFPSYTVHKALPCRVSDQIRLSFDVRYQSADLPIDAASLRPHCELDWDDIYAGWSDANDLRYYWEENAPQLSTWDDTLTLPGRRIC